jgi:hypothetical protein
MNISAFMVDGAQKDKLKQVELIGDIMRDSSRYDSILKERALIVKPIINFWKNGRINNALDVLERYFMAHSVQKIKIYQPLLTVSIQLSKLLCLKLLLHLKLR